MPHVSHAEIKSAMTSLSKADALTDLEAFAKRLCEEAAYIELHQAKPFETIEKLKQELLSSIKVADFTRELQKVIAPIVLRCFKGQTF